MLLLNERKIFFGDEDMRIIVGFENGDIIRFNATTNKRSHISFFPFLSFFLSLSLSLS
jgi:hypothetical protein